MFAKDLYHRYLKLLLLKYEIAENIELTNNLF